MNLDLKLQEEGDKLFREGKFFDAEIVYMQIKDQFLRDWSCGVINYSIGNDYFAFGNFLLAEEGAKKQQKLQDILKVRYALGKVRYQRGDFEGARENLEDVLLRKPSFDIKEDAERMLRLMRFGVITKLSKGFKNLMLNNSAYVSYGALLGSIIAQFDTKRADDILNIRNHGLSISLLTCLGSLSLMNTLSKRFLRNKRKDIEFDSLIKDGVKKEVYSKDILRDFYDEFKELVKSPTQPLFIYSLTDLLSSHYLGLGLGFVDFVGYKIWRGFKEKKFNEKLINLENLAKYSIPISLGTWFSLSWLNNLVIKNPEFPLLSIAYLTHISLRLNEEKILFKRDRTNLEYIYNRLNKISLIGGLITAGLIENLQINQFENILINELVDLGRIISYSPSNFLTLTAMSTFVIKHSLNSVVDQEFKSNEKLSFDSIFKKPFVHYPLTLGLLGGIYGVANNGSDIPLSQNLHDFLFYSLSIGFGSAILGDLTRAIGNLKDYHSYFLNRAKGNLDGAIEIYKQIVSRPYGPVEKKLKHLNLADLFLERGDEEKKSDQEAAFKELSKAEKIGFGNLGFFNSVKKIFRFSNLESKEDLKSKRRLAFLYSGLGNREKAKKYWRESLSLENNLINNCLYAEFLTKNNFEEANEQWRRVISLISDQKPEVEGLDSTHIVQHIKGKYLDYVLKYGDKGDLEKELDLTSKLAEKVRDHSEFLAPDPLTVFEFEGESVLATRYLKMEPIDSGDINLLKKIVEYIHRIYTINLSLKKRDVVSLIRERVDKFIFLTGDTRFVNLADNIYCISQPYFDSFSVVCTDPSPPNWGIVRDDARDLIFRCDLENKGMWPPLMDISGLLLPSKLSNKKDIVDYYIEGFPQKIRNELKDKGEVGYHSIALLRGIQLIPNLIKSKRSKAREELEIIINSMDHSFKLLEDYSRTRSDSEKSYKIFEQLRPIIMN